MVESGNAFVHAAKQYQMTDSLHGMMHVFERTMIPDLNCFSVKTVDRFSDGARNEDKVDAIVEGQPPDAVFSAPSDYVERSPSEMEQAYQDKFNRQGFYGLSQAKDMDKVYFR